MTMPVRGTEVFLVKSIAYILFRVNLGERLNVSLFYVNYKVEKLTKLDETFKIISFYIQGILPNVF